MGETQNITAFGWVAAGMLGMFLLAIGVVYFFLAYQKRILKQQKEHQQKEAEYQQQLLRANLLSQERERNRIGKDLHDGVGAILSTSKLYFRHLNQEDSPEKFGELKQKAMDLLDETMASVRRVSHDLKPVVLERLGLVEAVANMADQLSESGVIKVCFKSTLEGEMDKEFELNWFRIVQELINNTLKHSGANEIFMELKGKDEQVQFSYSDNGVGLQDDASTNAGLGMQNIASRLSLMQGKFEYGESHQNGFSLEMYAALWPLTDQTSQSGLFNEKTKKIEDD